MPGGSHEPFENEYNRHKKAYWFPNLAKITSAKYHKHIQESKPLAANIMIEQQLICLVQEW
jgi:hypothetical protein